MQTYERDFIITLRDVQEFHLVLMRSGWLKAILGFGLVGGLVAALYLPMVGADLSFGAKAAIIALATLVGIGAVALGFTVSTRLRVQHQVRSSGRDEYLQEVLIDAFGIHVTVGKDKAKLGFDKLVKVWETQNAFYIFITASEAWILPKEQMADQEEETARLRTIFNTVVESKRLKLRKD